MSLSPHIHHQHFHMISGGGFLPAEDQQQVYRIPIAAPQHYFGKVPIKGAQSQSDDLSQRQQQTGTGQQGAQSQQQFQQPLSQDQQQYSLSQEQQLHQRQLLQQQLHHQQNQQQLPQQLQQNQQQLPQQQFQQQLPQQQFQQNQQQLPQQQFQQSQLLQQQLPQQHYMEQHNVQRNATAQLVEVRELPASVHEVIRPIRKEIVQPLVYRDIERVNIQQLKQPIFERDIRPLQVQEIENQPIANPEVRCDMRVEERQTYNALYQDTSRVEQMPEVIDRAALQQPYWVETLHPKIIEERKPIVHREVILPTLVKIVQPYYEKVVEAPTLQIQELPAIHREAPITNPQVVWGEVKPGLRFQSPMVIEVDVSRYAAPTA